MNNIDIKFITRKINYELFIYIILLFKKTLKIKSISDLFSKFDREIISKNITQLEKKNQIRYLIALTI